MGWNCRCLGIGIVLLLVFALGSAGADTTASTSKQWHRLQPDQTATFTIDQDDIPFTEIRFSLKNMTENVNVEINVLSSNDTLIEAPAPGEVYEYIRLIATNIQTSNLQSTVMKFKVTNDWISDNNIDRDGIAIYQYETSWSKLETDFLSEDKDYIYYFFPLERFSMFAISGEKLPPVLLCTLGEMKCQDNDLYLCSSDGTAWELSENCTYGCESGACREEPSCPTPTVCPGPDELCEPCPLPEECDYTPCLALIAALAALVMVLVALRALHK